MQVENWQPGRDGALDEIALRHKLEGRGYIISPRAYPAGSTTVVHPAPGERVCGVISGVVKVTVDRDAAVLKPGDIVTIRSGAPRTMEALEQTAARCLEGARIGEHTPSDTTTS